MTKKHSKESLEGGMYEICNPVFRRYAMLILSAALLYVYYTSNNLPENANALTRFIRHRIDIIDRGTRAAGPLFQGIWNSALMYWNGNTLPVGIQDIAQQAFNGIETLIATEALFSAFMASSWIVYVICALLTGAYNIAEFSARNPQLIILLMTTAAAAAAYRNLPSAVLPQDDGML